MKYRTFLADPPWRYDNTASRRRHSQKPREFLDLVRSSSPGPYLELFSRCGGGDDCTCSRCLYGWSAWGNQAGGNPSQGVLETRHSLPLCGRCGQLIPKPKRGPVGQWCSAKCRTAAWRERKLAVAA